jgi:D-arabinose 1-dehydrogenase-like Zn-dependent alcohol dehydrogenase
MDSMRAVQVGRAGGGLEVVKRPRPEPGRGQVRIKVAACGICHSDAYVKEGTFPGISYPRIPGHEIAGVVDRVGPEVEGFKPGDRVGVGWHGSHCSVCSACRAGDFINCERSGITGITHDGGYAEYAVARHEAVARIPEGIELAEAAPLLCAGITTYNALRHSGAGPGDVVAVHGLGGLGHLGVQFAKKMGFRTVALSRGAEKEALARRLGCDDYIDAAAGDPAAALQRLGGARVILATAPDGRSIAPLVDGLGLNGRLVIVAAAADPIPVSALQLLRGRRSIQGWASGHARDSEDTLHFAVLTGVRPMIEVFPLERAAEAYERMLGNKVRFRAVLKTGD